MAAVLLAGLLLSHGGSYALAGETQAKSFETWRTGFEAGIPARMAAGKVSGAAITITSKYSSTPYIAAFGFADLKQGRNFTVDTPTHLASISKLFTASALVQLFDRQGLSLHDDVNDYIEFSVRNPNHPDVPITPFQLLTHTSGISDTEYDDEEDLIITHKDPTQSLSSFLQSYLVPGGHFYSQKKSFYDWQAGSQWNYSNVGMALAGHIVETVSNQDFSSYTESNIFEPLGIHNAHWYLRDFAPNVLAKPYEFEDGKFRELPQEGYPDVPAGMLRCCIADFSKMLHAMIGGDPGECAILSPSDVDAMLRPQVDPSIIPYQGLGWISEPVNGKNFVGHSGSDDGALNLAVLTDDQSHAVAVLMNIDYSKESDQFRSSVIEDLLVGATLME
jgi:CubicO group peptidase (beta-lactamase class C family)